MKGIIANDGGEFSDGRDVLLLVGGQSGDELLECRKDVGGGVNSLVLFADNRERPVGRVQSLRAKNSVPSGRSNVKFEELMVVRGQRCAPRCSGGQKCCACRG